MALCQIRLILLADRLWVRLNSQFLKKQLESAHKYLFPGKDPLLQQLPLAAVDDMVPVQDILPRRKPCLLQRPAKRNRLRLGKVQQRVIQIKQDGCNHSSFLPRFFQ